MYRKCPAELVKINRKLYLKFGEHEFYSISQPASGCNDIHWVNKGNIKPSSFSLLTEPKKHKKLLDKLKPHMNIVHYMNLMRYFKKCNLI
jgi:hypothetical protein